MQRKSRVVQVGCGGRGQAHLRATLAQPRDIELVALCDMDKAKLDAAVKQFNFAGRTYTSMAEMLRREKYDVADIITPPTIRVGIVEEAVKCGARAILIEKPICLRPSEARRLGVIGKKALIGVNTQYQWMPHWQKFWKLLAAKRLGKIQFIRASTRTNILEQGPHIMDLAMKAAMISGLPWPETVLAGCSGLERFGKDPVPADTAAVVTLGDARLYLTAGPSAPAVPNETVYWYHIQVDIVGERGRLWVSLNQGYKLWLNGKFESGVTDWNINDGQSQRGIIRGICEAVRSRKKNQFPTRVEVGVRLSDLFFACYESALTNQTIKLPANLDDGVVSRLERLAPKK